MKKNLVFFWPKKIELGQNLKSVIFLEKSSRVQLTLIFNHKYIHYIIFENLSIFQKKRLSFFHEIFFNKKIIPQYIKMSDFLIYRRTGC